MSVAKLAAGSPQPIGQWWRVYNHPHSRSYKKTPQSCVKTKPNQNNDGECRLVKSSKASQLLAPPRLAMISVTNPSLPPIPASLTFARNHMCKATHSNQWTGVGDPTVGCRWTSWVSRNNLAQGHQDRVQSGGLQIVSQKFRVHQDFVLENYGSYERSLETRTSN